MIRTEMCSIIVFNDVAVFPIVFFFNETFNNYRRNIGRMLSLATMVREVAMMHDVIFLPCH